MQTTEPSGRVSRRTRREAEGLSPEGGSRARRRASQPTRRRSPPRVHTHACAYVHMCMYLHMSVSMCSPGRMRMETAPDATTDTLAYKAPGPSNKLSYACTHGYGHVHTHAHVHVHAHVHTYTRVHPHACTCRSQAGGAYDRTCAAAARAHPRGAARRLQRASAAAGCRAHMLSICIYTQIYTYISACECECGCRRGTRWAGARTASR